MFGTDNKVEPSYNKNNFAEFKAFCILICVVLLKHRSVKRVKAVKLQGQTVFINIIAIENEYFTNKK